MTPALALSNAGYSSRSLPDKLGFKPGSAAHRLDPVEGGGHGSSLVEPEVDDPQGEAQVISRLRMC
jgi:hypothetical protein